MDSNKGSIQVERLVEDYSFGLVAADQLVVDNTGITLLSLEYGSGATHNFDQVSCFVTGTLIATPNGEKPIEELKRGDLVVATNGRTLPVSG